MSKEYTYIDKSTDLVGKTVQSITFGDKTMFLVFDDKTWTAVESRMEQYEDYLDTPRLVLKGCIDHEQEYRAGIINRDEYNNKVKQFMKNQRRTRTRQEKEIYERLKAKFEK